MIRSMTGFAAASRESAQGRVAVTIKTVNHRFLDVAVKAPSTMPAADSRIRTRVQQKLSRGRIEVAVSADLLQPLERDVVLDTDLLARVVAVVDAARDRGTITGTLTASDLVRLPQVLEIRTKPADTGTSPPADALLDLVDEAVTEALDALVVMRETEGRLLARDLEDRLAAVAGFVETLQAEAASAEQDLAARLRDRVAALTVELQLDPAAVAQEVVRFVARSEVTEEVVRLRTHVEHWRSLAAGAEPCGRKLDFLVQEMNREVNTIGSKIEGSRSGSIVIAAKAELERLREQVQNVE